MSLDKQDKLWIIEQLQRFATSKPVEQVDTATLPAGPHNLASTAAARKRAIAAALRALDEERNAIRKLGDRLEGWSAAL